MVLLLISFALAVIYRKTLKYLSGFLLYYLACISSVPHPMFSVLNPSILSLYLLCCFVWLGNQCAEYWIIIVIAGYKFRGSAGRAEVGVIFIEILDILLDCTWLGWM